MGFREKLIELKFEFDGKSNAAKVLSGDLFIEIVPENASEWGESSVHFIYLYSPEFYLVICELFNVYKDEANKIRPRKLRDDKRGCLGMTTIELEMNNGQLGTWLGGEFLTVGQLSVNLLSIEGYKDVLNLFNAKVSYIAWIESLWVFLYLCVRNGIPSERAYAYVVDQSNLDKIKTWKMLGQPCGSLIDKFYDIVKKVTVKR